MTKRTILVPVDDTADSERAVDWALSNLYQKGDELYFLFVVSGTSFVVLGGDAAETIVEEDKSAEDKVFQDATAAVERRFAPKAAAASAAYKIEIARGLTDNESIGDTVCKRADSLNALAVVMVKHQRSAIKKWFMGSVTNTVAHQCKQPVVVLGH
ncbi:hypothetical protein WJX81_003741 [Elliptochloris bilobata]|uniref:UspA domain-containing protein n=1 Tax=Elliptochloris bilobata TaxID=381761 RepID=A0AAW1RXY0_9CHLO